MKINCIACGHKVDVGDAYDDYEGPIRCCICGSLLQIKTEDGNLKSVNMAKTASPATAEEVFEHAG